MCKSRHRSIVVGLFFLLCASLFSQAGMSARLKPLAADKAFVFSYEIQRPNTVLLNWKIAPGYYLYREHLHLSTEPASTIAVQYPKTIKLLNKENQQSYEVYKNQLHFSVILENAQQVQTLTVHYQGCSERGFCYPPMHKKITLQLPPTHPVAANTAHSSQAAPQASSFSFKALLTNQNGIKDLLFSQSIVVTMLLFVGLGLLLAFTPCVLPMIPILTSIIVGQRQSVNTTKAFVLSLTYVMGTALTYALAGVAAASMGNSLQVWLQKPAVIAMVAALFVVLSLSLFGFYELSLPSRWQNRLTHLSNQQQGGTYIGVFLMGVLSTLIVSPCVTAPLVGVLMYIGQTGDLLLGASALFSLGIGMGIPLILIGVSAGKWLPKSGAWMEIVKKIFGILMLAMAIWLSSRVLSATVVITVWGLFLLGIACFLGLYLPNIIKLRKLAKSLGVVVGCSGMLVVFGGIGISNPMSVWLFPATLSPSVSQVFTVVRDVTEFNKQLLIAQASHKQIILDFYADWCESCIAMDKHVFSSPNVQARMNHYLLLRADLSANNSQDAALLKYFDVIAPPTVIFFDAKGQEIASRRIVGEVDVKEFLGRLENL